MNSNQRPKRNNNEVDFDEEAEADAYLPYFESKNIQRIISVYLDENILNPKYYRAVVNKVMQLNEGDQVIYYVSSVGGRMDGLVSLIEANKISDADVLAVIIGECHSAASMFALSCPNVSVSPSATMMVHYITFGSGGKASDVKANVDHVLDFTANYFRDIYKGFLTDDEINTCIDTGKEIWMKSDEIMKRLENRQEYFKAIAEGTIKDEPLDLGNKAKPKTSRKRKPKTENINLE